MESERSSLERLSSLDEYFFLKESNLNILRLVFGVIKQNLHLEIKMEIYKEKLESVYHRALHNIPLTDKKDR